VDGDVAVKEIRCASAFQALDSAIKWMSHVSESGGGFWPLPGASPRFYLTQSSLVAEALFHDDRALGAVECVPHLHEA